MTEQNPGEIVIRREANAAAAEAAFEASYAETEATLEQLFALFERENTLLQNGQRREIAEYQEEKEALTLAFRESMGRLLSRPQFLQGDSNARREALGARIKGLQRLMGDNRVLLNAAKVATFRRIEAAVEARRRQMEAARPYGSAGERDSDGLRSTPSLLPDRKI